MSQDKVSPQAEAAQKALDMKNAKQAPDHPSAGRSADKGMNPAPNDEIAPSGALDAEGHRPVLERSRKAR